MKTKAEKIMSYNEAKLFISRCHRSEADENQRVYNKALRASLIALGYSENWVNGSFRDLLEDMYSFDNFEKFDKYRNLIFACRSLPALDRLMEVASNDGEIGHKEFLRLCEYSKAVCDKYSLVQ